MNRRPTIIDVAIAARVSKSTVARALSGSSAVDPETRERIWEAVEQLGYERNLAASSMRSGKRHLLGMIVPNSADPFWATLTRSVQDRALQHGFTTMVLSSDWDATKQRACMRALVRAGVDGILVNNVAPSIRELSMLDIPVVAVGSLGREAATVSSVHSDMQDSVGLAMRRLIAAGHRDMAVIGTTLRRACPFLDVARQCWQSLDMDSTRLMVEFGDYSVQSGRMAFSRLIARQPAPPLAVLTANDLMAIGAVLEARSLGWSCPGDVAILGMDGISAGQMMSPPLSTIAKPAIVIGAAAVDLAIGQIAGSAAIQELTLKCALIEGGTITRH